MSKNVSSQHRISLKSQWKVEKKELLEHPEQAEFSAFRAFHSPTGVTSLQSVCFCFEPIEPKPVFFLNGFELAWNKMGGLATVPITSMMKPMNRVELRWRGDPQETPHLPEHFKAWLEISNDSALDPEPS